MEKAPHLGVRFRSDSNVEACRDEESSRRVPYKVHVRCVSMSSRVTRGTSSDNGRSHHVFIYAPA